MGVAGLKRGCAPEELDVRTTDGWSLRADMREPVAAPVGVVVLAHGLMARRTEFARPSEEAGLAGFLRSRGWRVVTFDFRAHGDSHPLVREGGSYAYDDLVARDLPAVCAFARSRARPKLKVIVLGHSLGGHTALAAQGTGAIAVDGIVGFGACPWIPQLEPSRARWALKRATLAGAAVLARRMGRLPSRALGRGSDDEPRAVIEDFDRFARTGAWAGRQGAHEAGAPGGALDYLAALENVRVPVLQVVSDGDRLECPPGCGERLLAALGGGGAREIVRVKRRDDGSAPPGHMGLVTSGRVVSAWARVDSHMQSWL